MGRALSIIGVPTSAANFSAALEGLTALNEQLMRDAPEPPPPLYAAGVVYTKRGSGKWRTYQDVLATGAGDCEALAPWRAAELRFTGEDPGASVMAYKTGKTKFHAVVLRGDGQIEDPSVALGMKAPRGLQETYQMWNNAALNQRMPEPDGGAGDIAVMGMDSDDVACVGIGPDDDDTDAITFHMREERDGGQRRYRGHARVPIGGGRALYAQTSSARSPREAGEKVTAVVGFVGSVWDDVQALVAPFPQAAAALRIARNTHVQNIARAAYNAVRGRKSGSSGSSGSSGQSYNGGQPYQEAPVQSPLAAPPGMPTDGGMMPPMGAPTGADLSDPAYFDDMAQLGPADFAGAGYYPPPAFNNDDVYQQLLAVKAQDDLDSGVYGFGPTPYEQAQIDQVNGFLAAGSRPSVGATFVQRGGANFRSVKLASPLTESVNSQLNSGLPAVNPGTGWTSAAAQLGLSSPPLPGSGWSAVPGGSAAAAPPPPAPLGAITAFHTSLPGGGALPFGITWGAAPQYASPGSAYTGSGYYPNYPSYSGGGVSSTGVPYGAAAGGGAGYDPTPGGYLASSGGGGGSGDPIDAFFGNSDGLSQDDKYDMLAAYGSSGDDGYDPSDPYSQGGPSPSYDPYSQAAPSAGQSSYAASGRPPLPAGHR